MNNERLDPFKEERFVSPLNRNEDGKLEEKLTEFKNSNQWVVRERPVESLAFTGEGFKTEISGTEVCERIKNLFDEFENKYGIATAPRHFILGHGPDGQQEMFVVTKKIIGEVLGKAIESLASDTELQTKFTKFLKSLISYFLDKYKTNDFALSDVGALFQYRYGTPIDDPSAAKQIFLVDTDLGAARAGGMMGEVAFLTDEVAKLEQATQSVASDVRSLLSELVKELETRGDAGFPLETIEEFLRT